MLDLFIVTVVTVSLFGFFFGQYPLVKPVVTPRFALSCTGALLKQLGEIAKNNKLHIQVSTLWYEGGFTVKVISEGSVWFLNNAINTPTHYF